MATQLLLVSETARALGVSATTVRDMERSGRLKATKTPSGVRLFNANHISKLAAERKRKSDK